LLESYNLKITKSIEDIIEFHFHFERIHPFQDGNGRVGRLILFKECLANNIVPFIIEDEYKFFYYRGLTEYLSKKEYLIETCLAAQDEYKRMIDYFYPEN
jgi:Fic family protein